MRAKGGRDMVKRATAGTVAVMLGMLLGPLAWAQAAPDVGTLSKEVEALKAGQAALQKDLQEIKSLLQGAPAAAAAAPAARAPGAQPVEVALNLAGAPVKGEDNAKVTIVEFTDYQCPFCSRHHRQTWPQLEQEYIATGKARLVLRDLPLEAIHPQALKAAEAALCAGEQGKYWDMHDRLFANQRGLSRKDLTENAQGLGLNVTAFDQCVDSGKLTTRVRKDVADASAAGAVATPTFFFGLTEPNSSQLKAVRVLRGAQPYAAFKEAIDSLLATAK